MKIAVIGNGLLSQVSATLFASVGSQTVLFDKESLNDAFLKEPGLERLYEEQKAAGRITYLRPGEKNSRNFDFIILADISPNEAFKQYQGELDQSIKNGTHFIINTIRNW